MLVKIREVARKQKNWSLYRLAQEMDLPQTTVYSWSWGRTQPSYKNMDHLCSLLGCSMSDLFEPEPPQIKIKF